MHAANPLVVALDEVQAAEAELSRYLRQPTPSPGLKGWLGKLFSFSQATETALSQAGTDAAFASWRKLGHALETLALCLDATPDLADPDRREVHTALAFYRTLYQQAEPLVRPSAQGTLHSAPPEPLAEAHRWLEEHIDPLSERLKELDHQARLKQAARRELDQL